MVVAAGILSINLILVFHEGQKAAQAQWQPVKEKLVVMLLEAKRNCKELIQQNVALPNEKESEQRLWGKKVEDLISEAQRDRAALMQRNAVLLNEKESEQRSWVRKVDQSLRELNETRCLLRKVEKRCKLLERGARATVATALVVGAISFAWPLLST
ncbi:hypothetical protein [Lacisediminimonas profundi]|uniref:hypothetical protein n=1 Tax=Lacisediminimonas profundi TaxID=2603856 RepID=UPI00124B1473|nr:hypothetical protein [Lacisediminimonas profundi]